MRWGVLGPLQVIDDSGEEIAIPAGRARVLLAALLTGVDHVVPVDELCELLWDGAPPPGAHRTARVHVVRLRHALGPDAASRIVTRSPGYLLLLGDDEFDLARFEQLCRAARQATRIFDWSQAAASFLEALGLWRGTPLADVPSQALRDRELPRLEQLRLQAVEDHIDAEMHQDRPQHLIPRLQDLVARHPLREHMHAQLVRVLDLVGRRAEALQAFQDARRTLIEQLGIEPGPELQSLQQRILAGEDRPEATASTAAAPAVPAVESPGPVRQLPAAVRHFAGRAPELKALSNLLDQSAQGGATAVVSAVSGTAGIGKTALAVHWAHRHAEQFPDGQLYVNLRGFGPSAAPLSPDTALRGLLDGLGVPAARIPVDPDAQGALYRSRLAGRRVLLVLDNAKDAEQVRPLLPGSATCLTLVTSRDRLTGLVALDGAVPVLLDLLTLDEARELLVRRLGAERVEAEDGLVPELIGLCAGLPLALNIVAAHAAASPSLSLRTMADELRSARRLDTLTTGDAAADARAAFSWSYRALEPGTAHLFRLISLAPGTGLTCAAAAVLIREPPETARTALEALVDAGLLQQPVRGRYHLHDLLQAYAAERALADESAELCDERIARLCTWYLRTAVDAAHVVSPNRRLPTVDGTGEAATPEVHGYDEAVGRLDDEYGNLVAVLRIARSRGRHEIAWKTAIALWDVFHLRGRFADLIDTHLLALDSARRLGDDAAQGWLLSHLSVAYSTVGSADEAIDCLRRALAIDRETGDRRSEAVNLVNLGYAYYNRGEFERAIATFESAAQAARVTGHWRAEAAALNNIGDAYKHLGRLDAALEHTEAAMEIHRRQQDRQAEGASCATLAEIKRLAGDTAGSFRCCHTAVRMNRETGNRREEANALATLGYLLVSEGHRDEARRSWRAAESILTEIGDPAAADIRTQLAALE